MKASETEKFLIRNLNVYPICGLSTDLWTNFGVMKNSQIEVSTVINVINTFSIIFLAEKANVCAL